MKRIALIFLATLFGFPAFSQNAFISLEVKKTPPASAFSLRAVQVNVLEFKELSQLVQWFQTLKKAGFNTIILRVFHNPGDRFHQLCVPQTKSGVYFRSNSVPVVCDLTEKVAQLAHQEGLNFYAWMNTRSADYGWESRTDLHSWSYNPQTQNYYPGKQLSIFHPEVQARLSNLYGELAQNPVDGVLVQDDLMLRYNEDFHPLAFHLYLKEQGKLPSPALFYLVGEDRAGKKWVKDYTPQFWEWNEWKIKKLLNFADRLKKVIKDQKPEVQFGLNFYYETALKPEKAKAWFSQDLQKASELNFDFYSLMLYHRQIQEELKLSDAELNSALELARKNFFSLISEPGKAVLKLMTRDFHNGEPIPNEEMKRIIKIISTPPQSGIVFFSPAPEKTEELSRLILESGENK